MARTRRWFRWLLGVGEALLVFGVTFYGPYVLANHQYEKLTALNPKTRLELERALFFTQHQPITKAQSHWVRHSAIVGQFERHTVFGEPIDVVYSGDRVVAVFSSFE